MNIALVHDFLREYGGAERVVEVLHEQFPEAPLYTAFVDLAALGPQSKRFAHWDIRTTKIQHFPLVKWLFSPYRIFASWAFSQLDLTEYDVVISSTNMYMAKAVKIRPGAKHISYVHTPPRSLYGYTTKSNWKKNPFIRIAGEAINVWMRYADYQSAQNPDVLVANSRTTQERIKKFYRRDSVVIPPPVELVDKKIKVLPAGERGYVLFVGRLAYSKHPEIAVRICTELNLSLKVVGAGALRESLEELAGELVEFLGSPNDEELAKLYQHAQCVLFPAEDEDFGIVPIEAMAAGTPVIAHYSGEPRYTVTPGLSGLHVKTFDLKEWEAALTQALKTKWNYQNIQKSVQEFSRRNFIARLEQLLAE